MKLSLVLALLGLVALATATVYFQEDFGPGWESRWVISSVKEADGTLGQWVATPGKYFKDAVKDTGIQTSEDARFYQISAKFPPFSNKDKPLVIQYSVKLEQVIDCGGMYVKLLPPGLDQTKFDGDSPYNVMFGPDACGTTRRVHAILNYKGENHLIRETIPIESEQYRSNLYTFIINPDQTFEVLINGDLRTSGSIVDAWDILAPRKIPDPSVSKPDDWVDEPQIADPAAVKPDGWDDIPAELPDTEAVKPEDWDEELDGEWEPPTIPNPEYQGEWRPPMIDNPDYKGPWVHPLIDNPDFVDDPNIYAYEHEFLGIEIWQVKSGTIFDNFLVTDDIELAKSFATGYFAEKREAEGAAKELDQAAVKAQAEQERMDREKEMKAAAAAMNGDGDNDDDDNDNDDDDEEAAEEADAHDEL